ncbi:hypothetical protein NBRC10513_007086 [Rhodotorula toruloides]
MAVSGGFRSAAGEALEVESGLLPIHLELDRAVFCLGLRALSATPSHPLHDRINCARRSPATRHPSPLDRALSFLLLSHSTVEPIHPDPIPPWLPNPAPPVTLARGKEMGTYEHTQLVKLLPAGSLLVYSDGSLGDSGVVRAGIAGRQWDRTSKVVLEEGEEVEVEEWEAGARGWVSIRRCTWESSPESISHSRLSSTPLTLLHTSYPSTTPPPSPTRLTPRRHPASTSVLPSAGRSKSCNAPV